jgi:hypothetical protein
VQVDQQGNIMKKSLHQTPLPEVGLPDTTVAESLLLVTLRLWTITVRDGGTAVADWRGGLQAVGLGHIAGDIVAPLFALFCGTGESARPVVLHSCRLSNEELLFLNSIAAIQHRKVNQVHRWLSGFTFPATARVILPLLTRLAAAMEFKNLVLPVRTLNVRNDLQKRSIAVH